MLTSADHKKRAAQLAAAGQLHGEYQPGYRKRKSDSAEPLDIQQKRQRSEDIGGTPDEGVENGSDNSFSNGPAYSLNNVAPNPFDNGPTNQFDIRHLFGPHHFIPPSLQNTNPPPASKRRSPSEIASSERPPAPKKKTAYAISMLAEARKLRESLSKGSVFAEAASAGQGISSVNTNIEKESRAADLRANPENELEGEKPGTNMTNEAGKDVGIDIGNAPEDLSNRVDLTESAHPQRFDATPEPNLQNVNIKPEENTDQHAKSAHIQGTKNLPELNQPNINDPTNILSAGSNLEIGTFTALENDLPIDPLLLASDAERNRQKAIRDGEKSQDMAMNSLPTQKNDDKTRQDKTALSSTKGQQMLSPTLQNRDVSSTNPQPLLSSRAEPQTQRPFSPPYSRNQPKPGPQPLPSSRTEPGKRTSAVPPRNHKVPNSKPQRLPSSRADREKRTSAAPPRPRSAPKSKPQPLHNSRTEPRKEAMDLDKPGHCESDSFDLDIPVASLSDDDSPELDSRGTNRHNLDVPIEGLAEPNSLELNSPKPTLPVRSPKKTSPPETDRPNTSQLETAPPDTDRIISSRLETTPPDRDRHKTNLSEMSQPEKGRSEASQLEARRPDASRPEPSRPESSQVHPSRPEPNQSVASRPEASRAKPSCSEASGSEASRPEASRPEASRLEPNRLESSQLETRQQEPRQQEPRQHELRQQDPSHPKTGRSEASLSEASCPEASLPKTSRPETGRLERVSPPTSQPQTKQPTTTQSVRNRPKSSSSEPELRSTSPSEANPPNSNPFDSSVLSLPEPDLFSADLSGSELSTPPSRTSSVRSASPPTRPQWRDFESTEESPARAAKVLKSNGHGFMIPDSKTLFSPTKSRAEVSRNERESSSSTSTSQESSRKITKPPILTTSGNRLRRPSPRALVSAPKAISKAKSLPKELSSGPSKTSSQVQKSRNASKLSLVSMLGNESEDELSSFSPKKSARRPRRDENRESVDTANSQCGDEGYDCGRGFCLQCATSNEL